MPPLSSARIDHTQRSVRYRPAPQGAKTGNHQDRRQKDGRPLYAIGEIILVMGIERLEATEERGDRRRHSQHELKASLTDILLKHQSLVRDAMWQQVHPCRARLHQPTECRKLRRVLSA